MCGGGGRVFLCEAGDCRRSAHAPCFRDLGPPPAAGDPWHCHACRAPPVPAQYQGRCPCPVTGCTFVAVSVAKMLEHVRRNARGESHDAPHSSMQLSDFLVDTYGVRRCPACAQCFMRGGIEHHTSRCAVARAAPVVGVEVGGAADGIDAPPLDLRPFLLALAAMEPVSLQPLLDVRLPVSRRLAMTRLSALLQERVGRLYDVCHAALLACAGDDPAPEAEALASGAARFLRLLPLLVLRLPPGLRGPRAGARSRKRRHARGGTLGAPGPAVERPVLARVGLLEAGEWERFLQEARSDIAAGLVAPHAADAPPDADAAEEVDPVLRARLRTIDLAIARVRAGAVSKAAAVLMSSGVAPMDATRMAAFRELCPPPPPVLLPGPSDPAVARAAPGLTIAHPVAFPRAARAPSPAEVVAHWASHPDVCAAIACTWEGERPRPDFRLGGRLPSPPPLGGPPLPPGGCSWPVYEPPSPADPEGYYYTPVVPYSGWGEDVHAAPPRLRVSRDGACLEPPARRLQLVRWVHEQRLAKAGAIARGPLPLQVPTVATAAQRAVAVQARRAGTARGWRVLEMCSGLTCLDACLDAGMLIDSYSCCELDEGARAVAAASFAAVAASHPHRAQLAPGALDDAFALPQDVAVLLDALQDPQGWQRAALATTDLVVMGFPCVDVSGAPRHRTQRGLEGERSGGLFTMGKEVVRILAAANPRLSVVFENVATGWGATDAFRAEVCAGLTSALGRPVGCFEWSNSRLGKQQRRRLFFSDLDLTQPAFRVGGRVCDLALMDQAVRLFPVASGPEFPTLMRWPYTDAMEDGTALVYDLFRGHVRRLTASETEGIDGRPLGSTAHGGAQHGTRVRALGNAIAHSTGEAVFSLLDRSPPPRLPALDRASGAGGPAVARPPPPAGSALPHVLPELPPAVGECRGFLAVRAPDSSADFVAQDMQSATMWGARLERGAAAHGLRPFRPESLPSPAPPALAPSPDTPPVAAPVPAGRGAPRGPPAPLAITPEIVAQVLRELPPQRAAGPDGAVFEDYRALVLSRDRGFDAFYRVVLAFANGQLPPEYYRLVGGLEGMALWKSDDRDAIRPIGIPSAFVRIAERAMVAALRPRLRDATGSLQFAVAEPGGCVSIPLAVQALLERYPEWGVLQVDIRNAFNSVSWDAVLEALHADFPELVPWFELMHMQPGAPREYVLRRHGPPVEGEPDLVRVPLLRGLAQGGPLSGPLFALAIAGVLRRAAAAAEAGGVPFFFADDGTIVGPVDDLLRVFDSLRDGLRAVGCDINLAKCRAYSPAPATAACLEARGFPIGVPDPAGGDARRDLLDVLSVPVGSLDAQRGFLQRRLSDFLVQGRRIVALPAQEASVLLRLCHATRVGYWLQALPPDATAEMAEGFDAMTLELFACLLHGGAPLTGGRVDWDSPLPCSPSLPPAAASTLLRPFSLGAGGGFTRATLIRHAAFYGASALSFPRVLARLSAAGAQVAWAAVRSALLPVAAEGPVDGPLRARLLDAYSRVSQSRTFLEGARAHEDLPRGLLGPPSELEGYEPPTVASFCAPPPPPPEAPVGVDPLPPPELGFRGVQHRSSLLLHGDVFVRDYLSASAADRAFIFASAGALGPGLAAAIPWDVDRRATPPEMLSFWRTRLRMPQIGADPSAARALACTCAGAPVLDPYGVHAAICAVGGLPTRRVHDPVVSYVADFAARMRFQEVFVESYPFIGSHAGKRMDLEIRDDSLEGTVLIDFRHAHPECASRRLAGGRVPERAAAAASEQKAKHALYGGPSREVAAVFYGAAIETYGAPSEDLTKVLTLLTAGAATRGPWSGIGLDPEDACARALRQLREGIMCRLQRGVAQCIVSATRRAQFAPRAAGGGGHGGRGGRQPRSRLGQRRHPPACGLPDMDSAYRPRGGQVGAAGSARGPG